MVLWSVGSVVDQVTKLVGPTNVPLSISGTDMDSIVEQEINYVNTFTDDNVQLTDIAAQFQPAITDLTWSKVLLAIDANEGGVDKVSLGPLSTEQTEAGGNAALAKQLRADAVARLKELGRFVRFKRVIG